MKNTEQLVYEMLNPPKKKAAVAVVDSNIHREHILPSEKAFSYKMKMEALKAQGKRTDLAWMTAPLFTHRVSVWRSYGDKYDPVMMLFSKCDATKLLPISALYRSFGACQ